MLMLHLRDVQVFHSPLTSSSLLNLPPTIAPTCLTEMPPYIPWFLSLIMQCIWERSHHLWSSINNYLSFSLRAHHRSTTSLRLCDPASHKEETDYLLVGCCPEANEEEEATLTDIIITVLLASVRGPFCGVITVLSFTRHRMRHYFAHLQHPFVFLDAFFLKLTKIVTLVHTPQSVLSCSPWLIYYNIIPENWKRCTTATFSPS